MYQKFLWKIEELWEKSKEKTLPSSFDISRNYDEKGDSLYYPRFVRVQQFDPSPSKIPVFSDDYGSYLGLAQCQVLDVRGKLIYIVDNHNEMLYPLVEMRTQKKESFGVVHIDAHNDDALCEQRFEEKDFELNSIAKTISRTRISDFFDAISGKGIVSSVYRITDSHSFENFILPKDPFFLSLDIDIFGPEGDFVSLESKVNAIRKAWNKAEAICIATSPGFIEQKFAHEIIRILCYYQGNEE